MVSENNLLGQSLNYLVMQVNWHGNQSNPEVLRRGFPEVLESTVLGDASFAFSVVPSRQV